MPHRIAAAERATWSTLVAAALAAVTLGLALTVDAALPGDPTPAGLAASLLGQRVVLDGCLVLLGAAALAVLRGAPHWEPAVVLLTPALVGGLLWAYPDTLLPYLAYLVAAPATSLAVLCGPAIGWRSR